MNKKQILILKVAINETSYDLIKIHEDDEPDDLAEKFIMKHQLSPYKKKLLENLIEKQIDSIVERDLKLIQETLNTNRSKTPIIRNQSQPNSHREIGRIEKIGKIKSSAVIEKQMKSDLLLKKKKEEKIAEIFKSLNPGRDQKVSFGTIKNVELNTPILEIIRPVIENMIEKKLVLGLKEFARDVEKVIAKMNNGELERFFSSSNKQIAFNNHRSKRYQQILN
jgi:hypothetical protein